MNPDQVKMTTNMMKDNSEYRKAENKRIKTKNRDIRFRNFLRTRRR